MAARSEIGTVPDFSRYPDLVVMDLGMRVQSIRGLFALVSIGPKLKQVTPSNTKGLLHARLNIVYGLWPLHIGLRHYWQDLESLSAWSRAAPHLQWWRDFYADQKGVGIWHETFHMKGGMEAIYGNVSRPTGLATFLPMRPARGTMSSRHAAQGGEMLERLDTGHPIDL